MSYLPSLQKPQQLQNISVYSRPRLPSKNVRIFMQTELPLLKDRRFAADICNDDDAISDGSIGKRSLVIRGIDSNNHHQIARGKSAGSGNLVPSSGNFEPTCPFGHGISNPTPYQARRPPLGMRFCL
jgi:hypothetical protein